MSQTYDNIFNREFKEMMNSRKAVVTGFALGSVPLPDFTSLPSSGSNRSKIYLGAKTRKIALVRGVTEPFFERLTNTEVELVGRTKLMKRQVLSDGSFRKDKDDKYVVDEITVPHTSVAILSPISIGLKNTIKSDRGVDLAHKPSEGFRYIDYVDTKDGRRYIYLIPRINVFRLSLVALAISTSRHRNFYHGTRIALQNGHFVYLYTYPYTYRENLGSRVIGLKATTDFDAEVRHLLSFWKEKQVMFNIEDTSLSEQIGGVTNLGFQEMEGTLTTEDFVPYSISLADEKIDNLEDVK